MSAEEPIPSPPTLRLVLRPDNGVVTIGRAALAPVGNQRVIEVPDDRWAAYVALATTLGAEEEIGYNEATGAFAKRARAHTAEEQAEIAARADRRARLTRLDQDIEDFASLTAAERASAQLNTMTVVRAIARRLLAE
jgi:hypothetical protein